MINLQDSFDDVVTITTEEQQAFEAQLTLENISAKSILIAAGKTANKLYFIETGLLRTYHLYQGKEANTYFACDQQIITCYASFISQTPSFEYLEAIEDSSVYSITYDQLVTLYKYSSKFERLGRLFAEKSYLCVVDRTLTMQTKTAKEKYLDFISQYDPKIVSRVPQHQIATFLGIVPESLSRIRKELATS